MRGQRALVLSVTDVSAWVVAFAVFALLRYSEAATLPWQSVIAAGVVAGLLHVMVCWALRLHQGRLRTASIEEMVLLGAVTLGIGFLLFVVNLGPIWVPRSGPPLAACVALVLMASARAMWRQGQPTPARPTEGAALRTVVIGAGQAANDLIGSMKRDPNSRWKPVALLDDDPYKRHLRLHGVQVVGPCQALPRVLATTAAEAVVIAIPSAPSEVIARLSAVARHTDPDLEVKVLPAPAQLLDDHVGIRDVRDINVSDYLGRSQIDTDIGAISDYLTGRRVLVTGAGGSIGSELCRQIQRFDPAELMMLDRDESALHAVQLSIEGRALLDSSNVILCDIRDVIALRRVMADRRPDVVFHAAALKHLPMLEQYPAEAVKTNVWGTHNVMEACEAAGVERFVNISTDKAADPTSVLGWSKRLGERLTAGRAHGVEGAYLSVRFGNVLGSRGSVLTSFAHQIAVGGPVTVTDPDVTRYFMMVEEACQLVVQAAAIGSPGEVLVLDMGAPVRIVDVAQQLIAESGGGVEMEFTGLRPGEKLHEDLFGHEEPRDVRPRHPSVSHVPVPPIKVGEIAELPVCGDPSELKRLLARACAVDADDSSRR